MDLDLEGKVAVVTGAGKGIGLATVSALVVEGARVVAGSRTVQALEDLDGVSAVEVDLAVEDGPADLIARAISEHGRVDVLINNVGAIRPRLDGFLAVRDEDFAWAMEMNFFIALRASRAALADMVQRRSGTIVNVASVNAFFQPDGATVDYGAAKAALVNLTKSLAQEFGPSGIRVNAVSPGPVATDLWLGADGIAETAAKGQRRGCHHRTRDDHRRHRRLRDRSLHHARGGRQPHHAACLAGHRQRHRSQLCHRRRSHQDNLIPGLELQ